MNRSVTDEDSELQSLYVSFRFTRNLPKLLSNSVRAGAQALKRGSFMSTQEESLYDIFAGEIEERPLWLVAVSGLSQAVAVMNHVAMKHPGAYFVLDRNRRIVAQIDGRKTRLSA